MWLRHCLQPQLRIGISAEISCLAYLSCPSCFDTVEWVTHWQMRSKHPLHACFCFPLSFMLCIRGFVPQACS